MLNNQPAPPISILPDEILTLIFSYLNPRELLNAERVATLWQRVSNEPAIWRNLINQYFPYLHQQNQNLSPVGFKALFTQKLRGINKLIKNHPEYTSIKPYLFAGLSGDIEKIEKSEINDNAKERLYIFAAANGHLKGLSKLKEDAKGRALKLAAQNGYLPACQMILTQAEQQISAQDKDQALKNAAQNGHLNVVQALLTHTAGQKVSVEQGLIVYWRTHVADIHKASQFLAVFLPPMFSSSPQHLSEHVDKGQALQWAAKKGHLEVVQVLVQAEQQISTEHKGLALQDAAENGQLNVVQYLLNQAGQVISVKHKAWALSNAARNGNLEVVRALLAHSGQQICAYDGGHALWNAARKGHLNVVQFLLNQAGQQISAGYKGMILKHAAEDGHQGVVSFLLKTYGHELSSLDVIKAIGFVRASQFYASRTATVLGNICASFAPSAPIEQLPLPSMTIPSLPSVTIHSLDKQSTLLPMATQEITTNAAKRKQESSPESTNNELDSDDESPEIKRAKLR